MYLNVRVDVNCGWKDGRTDGRKDGRKTGRLYRTLLKQVRQLMSKPVLHALDCRSENTYFILFRMA